MKYDVVVIGSGVSGMATAIILARQGRKVLVAEQGSIAGGLMQTYTRGGCCFPTGVHLLGSLDEGETLWRYFKYLGVYDRLDLVPMSSAAFHEYRFPGFTCHLPCGYDNIRNHLTGQFPSEAAAIIRFLGDMQETVKDFGFHHFQFSDRSESKWYERTSLTQYLDAITDDPKLKAVFSASNLFYGIEPDNCPVFVHFLVMDSFFLSACRVNESKTPLAAAFTDALADVGGEMMLNTRISRIECADRQVHAVITGDNRRIETENVIYTGHPKNLIDLCPPEAFRPAFKHRISDMPDTCAVYGINVKWQNPDCPPALCDTFIFDSLDTGRHYQPLTCDQTTPHMIYCSASPRPVKGSYAVTVLAIANRDHWADWEQTALSQRPDDYHHYKALFADRLFTILQQTWPHAATDMTRVESFSPLTFRDYTLTPNGSAYGVKKSLDAGHMVSLNPRTRVRGLLLTGQSIILPGIMGSLISAAVTCATQVGRQELIDQIIRETS